jgi:hypothetical protein
MAKRIVVAFTALLLGLSAAGLPSNSGTVAAAGGAARACFTFMGYYGGPYTIGSMPVYLANSSGAILRRGSTDSRGCATYYNLNAGTRYRIGVNRMLNYPYIDPTTGWPMNSYCYWQGYVSFIAPSSGVYNLGTWQIRYFYTGGFAPF